MKTSLSLDYRLTHGYVEGWKHLDTHIWVCIAQSTKAKRVSGDKYGDSETMKAVVTLSPLALKAAKANYRQVRRHFKQIPTFSRFLTYAIGSALSGGCQCEHDCCGHWQYGANAVQTKRREFVATINCYRNV